jgi:deoxyhypusine monooxygenase
VYIGPLSLLVRVSISFEGCVITMSAFAEPSEYRTCLLNLSEPIAKRTHAAFYLRTIGTLEAMTAIADALQQRSDSSLMRHELAYILGQMGFKECCPVLISILSDESEDVLVRHESAEALGNLGSAEVLEVLEKYQDHKAPEIAETCQIAVELIHYKLSEEGKNDKVNKAIYQSVDPAPAFGNNEETRSITELERDMSNKELSLFKRYRAMFSLRNMDSDESALALCKGLRDDSALFRHEVAYVLGQMMREVTVPSLITCLDTMTEHRMVRHEAAEALGAIGGTAVEEVLAKYRADEEPVVKESCEVALDTVTYWQDVFKADDGKEEVRDAPTATAK